MYYLVHILFTLNFSAVTTRYHTVAVFATVNPSTLFHKQFVGMFIIYLYTKSHIPKSSGQLLIAYDNNCWTFSVSSV
jgi:hypothetical protein